jgi:hypothetical protein
MEKISNAIGCFAMAPGSGSMVPTPTPMAMTAIGCCNALGRPEVPTGGTGTTPVSTNALI